MIKTREKSLYLCFGGNCQEMGVGIWIFCDLDMKIQFAIFLAIQMLISWDIWPTLYSLNWTPLLGHITYNGGHGKEETRNAPATGCWVYIDWRRADCVKFSPQNNNYASLGCSAAQPRRRAKVQPKFRVYNKIMAIKLVRIEVSRFPDCSAVRVRV